MPAISPHKLIHSNVAKDWLIPNKTLKQVTAYGHWCQKTSATLKSDKLHSFECWNQPKLILHSTSRHGYSPMCNMSVMSQCRYAPCSSCYEKGTHCVARSLVSHTLYTHDPICFQRDTSPNRNPNRTTYDISDLVTYQILWHYRPSAQIERYRDTKSFVHEELFTLTYGDCDTKGMVHEENVTVTQRTLCIKISLLWHMRIVTQRTWCTTGLCHIGPRGI